MSILWIPEVVTKITLELTNYGLNSLVFSYWTSTLDLLESVLSQNGIASLRIDGRVSYEQRILALESFRNDPQITVLLMSIQTGAVGYVLTLPCSCIVSWMLTAYKGSTLRLPIASTSSSRNGTHPLKSKQSLARFVWAKPVK